MWEGRLFALTKLLVGRSWGVCVSVAELGGKCSPQSGKMVRCRQAGPPTWIKNLLKVLRKIPLSKTSIPHLPSP